MDDKPMTARSMLMIDYEEQRLAARDRALAISIGRQVHAEMFKRDEIDDAREAERVAIRMAEMAAYLAIQKEREMHADAIRELKNWREARVAESMLSPMPIVLQTKQERENPE